MNKKITPNLYRCEQQIDSDIMVFLPWTQAWFKLLGKERWIRNANGIELSWDYVKPEYQTKAVIMRGAVCIQNRKLKLRPHSDQNTDLHIYMDAAIYQTPSRYSRKPGREKITNPDRRGSLEITRHQAKNSVQAPNMSELPLVYNESTIRGIVTLRDGDVLCYKPDYVREMGGRYQRQYFLKNVGGSLYYRQSRLHHRREWHKAAL